MENTQRRVLVCCQIRNAQLRGHGKCGLYTVNRLWLLFVFVLIKKKGICTGRRWLSDAKGKEGLLTGSGLLITTAL